MARRVSRPGNRPSATRRDEHGLDSGQPPNTGHNDGTHRLYKAHATGAAQLPARVLTPAETLAIRAPRGSRATRRPGTGRSGR
jgi:hypothetical protein